jgi:hypothetical protein
MHCSKFDHPPNTSARPTGTRHIIEEALLCATATSRPKGDDRDIPYL